MIVCVRDARLGIGARRYRGTAVIFEPADCGDLRRACAVLEPHYMHLDLHSRHDAVEHDWQWGVAFFSTDHPFGQRPGSITRTSGERVDLLTASGSLPLRLVSAVINTYGHSIFCVGRGEPPLTALEPWPAALGILVTPSN